MKKKRPSRAKHQIPATPQSTASLTFNVHDSHHHSKNNLWYLGIAILALAAMAGLYQAGEYLLMAVVVALAAAMFRLAGVGARQHEIRLNERGLTFGDDFYPYFQLRAFWLAEHAGVVSIYVERLNFSPTLHFVVPENRAEAVVEYLVDHLPWHHHRNEPLGDRLGRLLRF